MFCILPSVKNSGKKSSTSEMSRPVLSGDPINDSLDLLTTPAGVSDTLAFSRQYNDVADSVSGVTWEQDILLSRGLYKAVESLEDLRPD